jgi:general nucleoside transport system ATP-binding protein
MRNITKSYGHVRANRGIDLDVPPGRVVGLLGENGSGKTTLMNILFGMVGADAGAITFNGRPLAHHTPREAIAAGISMIHQHFMLVPALTVTENVMLGQREGGAWLRPHAVARRIQEASDAYGLHLDASTVVAGLSLGAQQRVEIVKAVLRDTMLLILDEPTSNLSPPEVAVLLGILRRLRDDGRSVVFISHKLGEVLELCDDVVVLRDGAVTTARPVAGATREDLAYLMVGRELPPPLERRPRAAGRELLLVSDLGARDGAGVARLRAVSFSIRESEIFAVAGVDGNGQGELADVIAGVRAPDTGAVFIDGRDVTAASVSERLAVGLAYVPADRASTGLVGAMTIAENLAMRDIAAPPHRRGWWLDRAATRLHAEARLRDFAVRAHGPEALAATLSGGNQQKVILARELGRQPRVVLAVQPTRGLDPGATRFVIEKILALREAGAAVLYVSTELDEILAVADRIGVMYGGRLVGVVRRQDADLTGIGLMMAGALEEPPEPALAYGVRP